MLFDIKFPFIGWICDMLFDKKNSLPLADIWYIIWYKIPPSLAGFVIYYLILDSLFGWICDMSFDIEFPFIGVFVIYYLI